MDYKNQSSFPNMAAQDLYDRFGNNVDEKYRTPSPVAEADQGLSKASAYHNDQTPSPSNAIPMAGDGKEPLTPKIAGLATHWNGLPSPITPNLNADFYPGRPDERETSSSDEFLQYASSGTHDNQIEAEALLITEQETSQATNADNVPSGSDIVGPDHDSQTPTALGDDGQKSVFATCENNSLDERQASAEYQQHGIQSLDQPEANTSSTSLRRSTRIHQQKKEKALSVQTRKTAVPAAAPTKKPMKVKVLQPLPDSEEIVIPTNSDLIRFEGLPKLHSIDWNLQYPPGGSTHPSYPYPNLDPRLIFCEKFVPLNEGLPDVHRVPKLLLPIGWRHVSWSGLLPIAFDPYLQAFKLTPVGPMALTCEELQQNGLHKYVPGGELHPETELLPQMVKYTDGSDEVVYNFEGIDWTLPWTEINNDLGLPLDFSQFGNTNDVGNFNAQNDQLSNMIQTAWCMEGWDCPNGIIDVADAWRWLREKEVQATPTFQPSEGKTWKGKGICRATRKFKQPIPSLMATAIAIRDENHEQYLVNQDRSEFCPFRSISTPVHIDISKLGIIEITLKEILCYFPSHYCWQKCADRLAKAGLSGGDVANIINMSRCLSADAAKKKSSISAYLNQVTHEESGDDAEVRIGQNNQELYTAQGWTYEKWEISDYPLLALPHGLISLPEDQDAGPLTKTIIWCRAQGRWEAMLSDVPALVDEAGIEKTIERITDECPDQKMLPRHLDALMIDRKRVLKSEKLKRALEESVESSAKKRKIE